MTDKANVDPAPPYAVSMFTRARQAAGQRSTDTIVSLPSRSEGASPAGDDRASGRAQDWSSALELVHEASEAIRISEERADELEARLEQVVAQASEELQRLSDELANSEHRAARSEERLRAAEQRTNEAEAWLIRLHEAVHTAFTPLQGRSQASDQPPVRREAPRD